MFFLTIHLKIKRLIFPFDHREKARWRCRHEEEKIEAKRRFLTPKCATIAPLDLYYSTNIHCFGFNFIETLFSRKYNYLYTTKNKLWSLLFLSLLFHHYIQAPFLFSHFEFLSYFILLGFILYICRLILKFLNYEKVFFYTFCYLFIFL
jgi:hypothetical protein